MLQNLRHLLVNRDANGIATITFDVQGSPVNVFNEEVFVELQHAIDSLELDPPRGVVFRSAKPTGFLAGADVHLIQGFRTADQVREVLTAGQELFNRIEHLPCPTIAVIHGPCLGGGLEFALACKYRIARDDSQTKIGLPEVQLGLIPGWGGTQRLPRLLGLRKSLQMILEGSTLLARKAADAGLVDLAAPPDSFEADAIRFIEDRIAGRSARRPARGLVGTLLEGTRPGRGVILSTARKRIASRDRQYPALGSALRAIEAGVKRPGVAGFAVERDEFVHVVFSPAARNLIDLFLQRERARKLATWVTGAIAPARIQKVAVVGGGIMGAGIAQLIAIQGTPVVLKDLTDELVAAGIKRIESLMSEATRKGVMTDVVAQEILGKIVPTSVWDPIAGAGLVIEAVIEREDVKREVYGQLGARLSSNAVFVSNTSALSIARLATGAPNPDRFAGLHFFNPVHRMPLVEVIRGSSTSEETIATLVEFVRKLGKVPVVVADSPGFLVNRILFPYLDEAVRLVLEGMPGEQVDRAAIQFGMPMGPLELLDQVGIDIAADVAKSFASLRNDAGPSPERFAQMVKDGSLGKKSGRGFYEYTSGRRGMSTRWAIPDTPHQMPSDEATEDLTRLQKRLIFPMINEAAKCLDSGIVAEPWMIDLAMVLGTGFAPFRGGPLKTADSCGLGRVMSDLRAFQAEYGARFDPASSLRETAREGRGFYSEPVALENAHR